MWDIIQGYIIIWLELICCQIFFDTFLKTKITNYRKMIIMSFLSVILMLSVFLFSAYFWVKQIIIILCITFGMKLYANYSFRKNFVLAVIFQGILLITDYITIVLKMIFFPGIDTMQGVSSTILIILSKAVLFLIIIVIKVAFGKKEFGILQDADWLKFLFFPIFTICVITALIANGTYSMPSSQEELFLIIAFGLVGMNIMVFYLLNDVLFREKKIRENQIFEIEAKNQLQRYEALSESIERQRKLSHEYHNQINLIQGLCENGKIEELKEYLLEMNGEVLHDLDCIDTHHAIVNVIVNEKYQEAVRKGILFVCKINDMSRLDIKKQDIVLLLSNLLNNAIEACEKCTNTKIIKFKLEHREDRLMISVKNSYAGKLVFQGEALQTSKVYDKENHGYGLKNVVRIIEKNQGDYIIKTTDTEFLISISIPQTITS